MIDNFIVYLIVALGIFASWILAKNTKEELKSGRKYFRIIQLIILIVLIALIAFKVNISLFSLVLLIIGGLLAYFVKEKYLWLGVVLGSFISSLTASLIFVYLLAEGKLKFEKKSLFFLFGIILLFFNLEKYIAFSLGSLIGIILSKR